MIIKDQLAQFGLDDREQVVYLLLLKKGWSTALQLARAGNIKRTTLYRVLESLGKKGLVETQLDDKTTYYNASDPKQFESLVIREETRANKLRQSYEDLNQSLRVLAEVKPGETSVRFYRGLRGLEHLHWKMCEQKNIEILIFDSGDNWYNKSGREFAETIRAEVVKQNIQIKELQNPQYMLPSNNDGVNSWTSNRKYVLNLFRHRSIEEKIFRITQDIYVVGVDKVCILGYRDNDIFGMEIVSEDFTLTMKQLFKILWNQAKVVDKFGGEDLL